MGFEMGLQSHQIKRAGLKSTPKAKKVEQKAQLFNIYIIYNKRLLLR